MKWNENDKTYIVLALVMKQILNKICLTYRVIKEGSLAITTICVVFTLLYSRTASGKISTIYWDNINFEQIEKILSKDPIKKIIPFGAQSTQEIFKGKNEEEMEQDQFFKLTDKQVSKSKMTKNNRKSKVHKSEIMSVKEFTMEKQRCWNDIDFKKTEEMLLNSVIHRKVPLHKYKNESEDISFFLSKLVSLLKGKRNYNYFVLYLDNNLKAIFKPNKGLEAMASALLAYHFSQFMNLKLVPPTVIREINGKKGIVQLFVDGIDGHKYDFVTYLTPVQKSNIYTFYFVLGEYDNPKRHLLFGKNCRKPALIDNEYSLKISFIVFGDYPFIAYKIKGLKLSLNNPQEFKRFPIDQVRHFKKTVSPLKLKQIFNNIDHDNLNHIYSYSPFGDDFYYVKWKNSYWLKHNFKDYKYVYKDFVPVIFSKQTISRLKKLNPININSFLTSYPIPKEKIFGILYRRDILLKKADSSGMRKIQ